MKKLKIILAVMATLVLGLGAVGVVHAVSTAGSDKQSAASYNVYAGEAFVIPEVKGKRRICVSKDKTVAKVHTDGSVDTKGPGKTLVDIYGLTTHKRVVLNVAKRQVIKTEKDAYDVEYKGKDILLNAKSNSVENSVLTYRSTNEDVATVTDKGVIDIKNPGSAEIVITAPKSETYHAEKKKIKINVGKKIPNIELPKSEYTISTISINEKIGAKTDSDGKIKYASSNTDIVDVEEDGTLTPKKEGEAKIKISIGENNYFAAASKEVTVKVTKPSANDKALAALAWAKDIANDDSFAYGVGKAAHRGGCYFCGTNQKRKPKGYEKTYCCNPFVFAAYAHGAQLPSVLSSCQNGGCGGMSVSDWTPHGFICIGEASKVPYEDLLPGDVVLSDTSRNGWIHHVWMVSDNDQYVEASGDGWGPNSIGVKNDLKKYYSKYQKHECYVMRYAE